MWVIGWKLQCDRQKPTCFHCTKLVKKCKYGKGRAARICKASGMRCLVLKLMNQSLAEATVCDGNVF